MRSPARRRGEVEEEESAFVSMTDMTVSFLFIVMILLAFFASQFRDQKLVPLEDLQAAEIARDNALTERDRATTERDAARDALVTAQLRIDDLERLILRLQARLAAAETDRDMAGDAVAALQARISALVAALAAQAENVTQLERDLAAAQADLTASRQSEDEMRARIARLLEIVVLREQEIERLTQKVKALEVELAKLKEPDPLERYLAQVAAERLRILELLQSQLLRDFPDLNVVISAENDALRFQGEGLFAFGARSLASDKRRIVEQIAERLDEILPCYTLGPRQHWTADCNPAGVIIEAVQIEGHTDDVGADLSNLELSANRASATYGAMLGRVSQLLDHRNFRGQPVLSVSGYGENRPVTDNTTPEARATNRRIDLRFIMYSPTRSDEIERIRAQLAALKPLQ